MGLLGGSKVLFPGPMGLGLSQGDGLDYHWWGLVATQFTQGPRLDDQGRATLSRDDDPAGLRVAIPPPHQRAALAALGTEMLLGKRRQGDGQILTTTR